MKLLRQIIQQYHLAFLNSILCGVIGATFGILGNALLVSTLIGLLVGAALGWLCMYGFIKLKVPENRYLRGFLILLILEALLVYYFVIPSYGAYYTIHPTRLPIEITPADMGIEYEEITLLTEDNIRIQGWYIPSTNGAALIGVHGLSGNRMHVMPYMHALTEQGYGWLLIDLRAHGESGGDVFAASWNSDLEILAALEYLMKKEQLDANRIGALGLSAGANAALYAAAKTDSIKALWVDGTGLGRTEDVLDPLLPELRALFFGMPLNYIHHVMIEVFSGVPAAPPIKEVIPFISPRPITFVAAGQDSLEKAIGRRYQAIAGDPSELWIIPDVQHLGGILAHPEDYSERMISFFNSSLFDDDWID